MTTGKHRCSTHRERKTFSTTTSIELWEKFDSLAKSTGLTKGHIMDQVLNLYFEKLESKEVSVYDTQL